MPEFITLPEMCWGGEDDSAKVFGVFMLNMVDLELVHNFCYLGDMLGKGVVQWKHQEQK